MAELETGWRKLLRWTDPCHEIRVAQRHGNDEHGGGASVDVTFAPVERDHYTPNQSSPEPRIPGQAAPARAGQRAPLSRRTTPRASEATRRRPSASGPSIKPRALSGNVL
jgi:hypothetical protein